MSDVVAAAADEGRNDILEHPLHAIALRCRAFSPRGARYLGMQSLLLPIEASLLELLERWRRVAAGDRGQRTSRFVERALGGLLLTPPPPIDADDKDVAALAIAHAEETAAPRIALGDDVTGAHRAICDQLWETAEAIAPFRASGAWGVRDTSAAIDLVPLGFRYREQRDRWRADVGVAHVEISARRVVAHGEPELRERALRCIYDVVAEPDGRELQHIQALLTPRHKVLIDALAGLARSGDVVREDRVCWLLQRSYGRFVITALVQKQQKRGGFSKGTRVSAREIVDAAHATEQERSAAKLLLAGMAGSDAEVLRTLVGHPRVFVDGDRIAPWSIVERRANVAFTDVEGGYAAGIVADGMNVDADDAARAHRRVMALFDDATKRIVLATISDEVRTFAIALGRSDGFVPAEAKAELVAAIERVGAVPLVLPASLEGERRAADTTVYARLIVDDTAPLEVKIGVRPAPGGALVAPGSGDVDFAGIVDQKRTIFQRDLDDERVRAGALRDQLQETGVDLVDDFTLRAHTDDIALAVLGVLDLAQRDGVVVEWKDQKRRIEVKGEGTAEQLRVRVRSVGEWLGVDGEIDVAGHLVSLGLLLESVRLGKKFVRVGEGQFIALANTLRERLAPLAAFSSNDSSSTAGTEVQVAPSAALALDDLSALGARFDESKLWLELRSRAERARACTDVPPADLQARLRPYQTQGVLFLRRLAAWGTGGVLADDMGLGKTLQAIAALLDRAPLGPQLVLAPTSVCFNWAREIQRFAPTLHAAVVSDQSDRASTIASVGAGDVLIVSYGLAVILDDTLRDKQFASAIFDEAQALKNADTQRAKMARGLDAQWKLALSGTPLENRLGELWSMFRVVSPGLLGGAEAFRKRFSIPIERDRSASKRKELAQTLRPFLLRRTRDEVLPELPQLTEIVVPVDLDDAERAIYDATRAALLLDVGADLDGASADRRFRVLAGLTRLRLLCCHRAFAHDVDASSIKDPSSKHQAVLHALAHVKENGHRALVFSQFVKHLDVVEAQLKQAGFLVLRLDGSTPPAERARRVDAFQAGAADVFLVSLKAGGAGLNLTAADYVLHLNPWWNPAVEDQATARAHRLGQQKPVTVYRFVARGTIEEQMLAMHDDKRDLVDSVLEGADAAAHLSMDALVALLKNSGQSPAS